MNLKILVVDDEIQIGKQLKFALEDYGHEVVIATSGKEAIARVAQFSFDVIVLDISLGSEPNGIEVCRTVREWSGTPIIMLSIRSEEKTKVQALQTGADDYMTKPFGIDELYARILNIHRRATSTATPDMPEIRAGALVINLVNRMVFVDDEEVHLTPKEYDLLRLLAVHRGKVLTHQMILDALWGGEYHNIHAVRVFVNQIRKKLRENPLRNIRYIISEPSIGYRFVGS